MNLLALFWEFLKAACLSFGGLGNLPILIQALVQDQGLASEAMFGQALAAGRISPGPNGLWVVALGYLLLGPAGAAAATVATLIPSFLILPLSAVYKRVERHPRVAGATRTIGLAVVGTLAVTAAQFVLSAAATGVVPLLIAVAAPVIVLARPQWNPVFVLVVAAIIGVLVFYRW